jgi:dihydroorotate dehydrogenase electron transfer subunit
MSSASLHDSLPGLVPTARQQIVRVVEQQQLAHDTYRLRLECPEIAREAVPGQFFMIRAPGQNDPLLGRPFALYDTYLDAAGEPAGIDIVYLVVGKMTGVMRAWQTGDRAEVWGPLGNGFPLPGSGPLLLVAGGIGQTPFLAVAREALGLRQYGRPPREFKQRPPEVILCYGARSASYLAGLDDFATVGLRVRIATDDGSQGHRGFVTELLVQELARGLSHPRIYCCGPELMMHAVARIAGDRQIPCWLSLETPMACGFGACFSCVTKVRQEHDGWDYRRVCVEGPIFPADQLVLSSRGDVAGE